MSETASERADRFIDAVRLYACALEHREIAQITVSGLTESEGKEAKVAIRAAFVAEERVPLLDRALRIACEDFSGCPPSRKFERGKCVWATRWECKRDWALAQAEEGDGGDDE